MVLTRDLLRKVSIFATLPDRDLELLAAGVTERTFEKDALSLGRRIPGMRCLSSRLVV